MSAELWTTIASAATAFGVFLVLWQIWQAKRQAVTGFEDSLAREYRSIVANLPVRALLGEDLTEAEYTRSLPAMYRYIDLCNEQVFLRQIGRVSSRTWRFWRVGIKTNLSRPAFNRAWAEIKERSQTDFQELRQLERSDFDDERRTWASWWRRKDRRREASFEPPASREVDNDSTNLKRVA